MVLMKRYWVIRGYDGDKIFEKKVGIGQFTDGQIRHLLQALAAKECLNFSEIVGAYAKRGTKISNDLLTVHRDFKYSTYRCGDGPTFTASVVDEDGKIIINPDI